MKPPLAVVDLGKMDYQKAYKIQQKLVEKRSNGKTSDLLLLVEHPPVYTIGAGGSEENIVISKKELENKGIQVYNIDRGGDITYHGPGQVVGYPILNLEYLKKDLHWLMRSYEEVFIKLLDHEFGIKAGRISGLTGVWVGDEKITAIGIGVRRWVTFHGFAFNFDPDLDKFGNIIPCGITDKGVTSLTEIKSVDIGFPEMKELISQYFAREFERELIKDEEKTARLAEEDITT